MNTFNPSPQKNKTEKKRDFTPYPEAHFLVNDIAEKFLNNISITENDRNFLHDLFLEIQDEYNTDITNKIVMLKNKEILTKVERGITSCYFLIAEQIGPNSDVLFEEFINQKISKQEFDNITKNISIPESISNLLVYVYGKLINQKGLDE